MRRGSGQVAVQRRDPTNPQVDTRSVPSVIAKMVPRERVGSLVAASGRSCGTHASLRGVKIVPVVAMLPLCKQVVDSQPATARDTSRTRNSAAAWPMMASDGTLA